MKTNKTIKGISIALFCIAIVSFAAIWVHYENQATHYIQARLPVVIKNAVQINAREKGVFFQVARFSIDPQDIGKFKEVFFRDKDTCFTYQSKVVDMETHIQRNRQTNLLLNNKLHSTDIKQIMDSLLRQENIRLPMSIGIKSSFYKKTDDWSTDTTQIASNFTTSILGQGDFEDIDYHVYADISLPAIWPFMPRTLIFFLLLVAGATGCSVVYCYKRKPSTNLTIEKRIFLLGCKENNSPFYAERTYIYIDNHFLKGGKVDARLSPRVEVLLAMFLHSPNLQVRKSYIKYLFWGSAEDTMGNMTSLINQGRKTLDEAQCGWILISEHKKAKHYTLKEVTTIDESSREKTKSFSSYSIY